MRRFFAALAAAILIFSAPAEIRADDGAHSVYLVALGDSITTGYEMEGGRYGCASYVNLTAEYLGLTRVDYANYAVNGYTAADMLELLPHYRTDIERADILVFDIGYNDILGYIYHFMCLAAYGDSLNMQMLCDTVYEMEETELTECVRRLREQADGPFFRALLNDFEANLRAVLDTLTEYAPDAHIYMQSIYNPLAALEIFSEFSEELVGRLNRILSETAVEYGCGFLDVHAAFASHESEFTYMRQYDIHPNEAGHRAIFELLTAALEADGISAPGSEPETSGSETDADTAVEVSDSERIKEPVQKNTLPAWLLLFPAALAAALAAFLILKKKNGHSR